MTKKTLGFQAEAAQLLKLMTHSLYSNREIFLRELVSNASDACDRLRLFALKNNDGKSEVGSPEISIELDDKAHTICIRDNGIGMLYQEVIDNLGTIARSGTAKFLQELGDDQQKNTNLIGQFGVGFYASFIVADKVVVETLKYGAETNKAVRFVCDGTSEYSIEGIELKSQGTAVTLHLKKDAFKFCETSEIRRIIKKYSDHINVPIMTQSENDKKEVEWEQINDASALWTKPAKEIKKEQYNELYKQVAHDWQDPLHYSHNHVEGTTEYISLLYLPQKPTFDLYKLDAARGLKLFIQRTFVMDDVEHFLPLYLRFIKGVIDTNDLPMNVSREILQKTPQVDKLKRALTKKTLDMLKKLASKKADLYEKFWSEFGNVLKEGIVEDQGNSEKIAKLLRFNTTKSEGEQQNVTLDTYLERKQEGQDKIYYLLSDSHQKAQNSPLIESLKQRSIEVLLLVDPIDEWLMQSFKEFEKTSFADVRHANLGSEQKEEDTKDTENPIIERIKTVLGERVEKVVDTKDRLIDSPACLISSADSLAMKQYMQALGQTAPPTKPIFELNCKHKLIQLLEQQKDDTIFNEIVEIVFDQARLAVGEQLEDPVLYVNRVNRLLQKHLQ